MKFYLFIFALFMCNAIFAEAVSNAELSRKLDLILGKVGGLEERVGKLESDNAKVKKEVKQVAQSAEEAKSATNALQIPKDEKEKESFFKNLKNQIYSQKAKDSGPWAKETNWGKVEKKLTRVQVRRLLGDPHQVKLNNNPRIDQVYLYSGDLNANGEADIGVVNFYRDRVVSFTSPFHSQSLFFSCLFFLSFLVLLFLFVTFLVFLLFFLALSLCFCFMMITTTS